VCDNGRFIRQDLLDQVVWTEVIRLLEIDVDSTRARSQARSGSRGRSNKEAGAGSTERNYSCWKERERILSAYQEGLVSLEQLRERMPPLRLREQALREEAEQSQTNPTTAPCSCAWLRLSQLF